ncbi:MAG: MATE family efflux transporter, partial [Oscillospiraceae bacterium]
MLYTLVIMAAGLILLEIFAEPLAALFGLSGETQQLCVSAIRMISLSFIFAGANVAFQGIFQALESGVQSLVISVCRQCLFVLPLAWGFSEIVISSGDTRSIWLVWLTFLIAEGASAVISVIFMTGIHKKRVKTLSDQY